MGYGTSRTGLQRVDGPGDAGIDAVISLYKLGLQKVYIEAKCWQQPVGRPEVQAFYGALAGQHAKTGPFYYHLGLYASVSRVYPLGGRYRTGCWSRRRAAFGLAHGSHLEMHSNNWHQQNGPEYLYQALDFVARGKVQTIVETYPRRKFR
jgi:restriction endonuclease Mrr